MYLALKAASEHRHEPPAGPAFQPTVKLARYLAVIRKASINMPNLSCPSAGTQDVIILIDASRQQTVYQGAQPAYVYAKKWKLLAKAVFK